MPTVEIIIEVAVTGTSDPPGEIFRVVGFPKGEVNSVFVEDSIVFDRTEIDITGLGGPTEPPPPVISARILGAPPSATEATIVDTLSAQLIDDESPPNVVEFYDPANWDWTIDSGGGSFGGVNGDELTMPAAPATVVIRATHLVEDVSATASIESVAVSPVQRKLQIYNVPANVVQGEQYTILAREIDSATGDTIEDPATGVTLAVTSGPGSISGGNTLNVNAGSAGGVIQVSATKAGINSDTASFNVIAQPTFPSNEPPGFTQLNLVDGSTTLWPGWTNQSPQWLNPDRVTTETDPASKYGQVTRKRFFIGEESGWHGLTVFPPATIFKEVYTRMVFRLSSNYDPHISGDKVFINRKNVGGDRAVGNNFFHRNLTVFFNHHTRLPGETNRNIWLNSIPRLIIPGSPPFTGGSGFGNGPFIKIIKGQFHTFEILRRMNSAANVADGLLRIWWDGVEITRFSLFGGGPDFQDYMFGNVEYISPLDAHLFPPGISPSLEAPLFWGGTGDTKQVNDFIDVSELYISTRD